jgi:hypothetical protein
MFKRTLRDSRVLGDATVQLLLVDKPERQSAWGSLGADDQEILSLWLGMSRGPWQRRERRNRAADALDLGADTVRRLLHHHVALTMPVDASSMPPFNI